MKRKQIQVDASTCPKCGKSTEIPPTIMCEKCNFWFHFECVGVNEQDECVIKEDVSYFCPTCIKFKNYPPSKRSNGDGSSLRLQSLRKIKEKEVELQTRSTRRTKASVNVRQASKKDKQNVQINIINMQKNRIKLNYLEEERMSKEKAAMSKQLEMHVKNADSFEFWIQKLHYENNELKDGYKTLDVENKRMKIENKQLKAELQKIQKLRLNENEQFKKAKSEAQGGNRIHQEANEKISNLKKEMQKSEANLQKEKINLIEAKKEVKILRIKNDELECKNNMERDNLKGAMELHKLIEEKSEIKHKSDIQKQIKMYSELKTQNDGLIWYTRERDEKVDKLQRIITENQKDRPRKPKKPAVMQGASKRVKYYTI